MTGQDVLRLLGSVRLPVKNAVPNPATRVSGGSAIRTMPAYLWRLTICLRIPVKLNSDSGVYE